MYLKTIIYGNVIFLIILAPIGGIIHEIKNLQHVFAVHWNGTKTDQSESLIQIFCNFWVKLP